MELTSKQKGNLTELQVITYLYGLGYQCSLPYGENSRYDLIADIDNHLIRIQVKTSSIKKGTKNDIEFFATYWENQCYLIPVSECSCQKTLRFCYPPNGQKQGISLAENYIAEKQIQKIKEEVI